MSKNPFRKSVHGKTRIFCPMATIWFDLVKSGKKTVEIRSCFSPVAHQIFNHAQKLPLPFPIEFRRGYSGQSIFGKMTNYKLMPPELISEEDVKKACIDRQQIQKMFSCYHVVLIYFTKDAK